MQELALTPATIILLLAIIGCALLAIRRLHKRGMCDCNDHGCEGCSKCSGGCKGCDHALKDVVL